MTLSKKTVEPMLDLAQVAEASQKLTGLLDSVLAYVEDVLAGRTQPDNAVGRALLDMVNSVPKMTPEEFENMFNSNIKVSNKAACFAHSYANKKSTPTADTHPLHHTLKSD
jgi:hypothetical protein